MCVFLCAYIVALQREKREGRGGGARQRSQPMLSGGKKKGRKRSGRLIILGMR